MTFELDDVARQSSSRGCLCAGVLRPASWYCVRACVFVYKIINLKLNYRKKRKEKGGMDGGWRRGYDADVDAARATSCYAHEYDSIASASAQAA